MTSRAWTFTVWHEPIQTFEKYSAQHPEWAKAFVCQLEFAPTTDAIHIQGFVRLTTPKRLSGVKKLFHSTTHLEVAKGTDEENIVYCTDRTKKVLASYQPLKFGTFEAQGKRTDLVDIYESGKAGTLKLEPATLPTAARYPRFFEKCLSLYRPGLRDIKVSYIWGPTGTGKTRGVYEAYPDVYALFSTSPEWWDGYDGQSVVLFDDFRGDLPCHRMLRLLDRYPIQVPVKGGSVALRATEIIITANIPPEDQYRKVDEPTREAWMRRLHIVTHLGPPPEPEAHWADQFLVPPPPYP